jgi:hypothetical protein
MRIETHRATARFMADLAEILCQSHAYRGPGHAAGETSTSRTYLTTGADTTPSFSIRSTILAARL